MNSTEAAMQLAERLSTDAYNWIQGSLEERALIALHVYIKSLEVQVEVYRTKIKVMGIALKELQE